MSKGVACVRSFYLGTNYEETLAGIMNTFFFGITTHIPTLLSTENRQTNPVMLFVWAKSLMLFRNAYETVNEQSWRFRILGTGFRLLVFSCCIQNCNLY
jgi:hypothetical protein